MSTNTLVTGASGHIGSNLVHDLVASGHRVVALVRKTSDLTAIEGLDVDVRMGDILDADSVRAAMDGCELVFHAAAVYKNWTADPEEMPRTANVGTRNVFAAAADAGVKRLVYTSSSNAVGFTGTLDAPLDEETWNEQPYAPYVRAKVTAERLAHQLSKETGVPMIAVLPTGVLGRFDYKTTPTTQTFLDMANGAAPIPFPINMVDVRDVARCHVLAAGRGEPGERYLAGSDNASEKQIAKFLLDELGARASVGLPPTWLLKIVAVGAGWVSSLTGREPMISREMVQELEFGNGPIFDCRKAREKLGFEPTSPVEVIREAGRWAAYLGTLRDKSVSERLPPDPAWPARP